MKRYSSICPSKNIKADPPAAVGQTLQIAQKGSDYSFVKDTLCRLECREFFVLAGKAYFIDASRKKQSVVSLEWGRDILLFPARGITYMKHFGFRWWIRTGRRNLWKRR